MTPDELAAVLFVGIVLTGLALVGAGRLVVAAAVMAERVKHSRSAESGYVAPVLDRPVTKNPFHQEREPEREPEPGDLAPEPAPAPAGKIYTADQIATLTAQAEERGRAQALGQLLGRGLVVDRATAMELVFGPRGRRHQRVRPLVDQAAAAVSPAPEPARLIGVSDGRQIDL